jgi:methyltransferase family protein
VLETLNNRDELGAWLTQHGFEGQAVEIGALNGANARQWISTWGQGTLTLIDPWKSQDPGIYKERQDWTDFEACYKECTMLAEQFKGRIILLRELSMNAVWQFDDKSLDCVYVDGNHAYEAAMADFCAWWPKLKSGGILGAHDYWLDRNPPAWGEVKMVADHFSEGMRIPFRHTPKCGSVWFQKP